MHLNMGTYLYGTKLIRTRTETLRNKRVFTEYYYLERCYIYININIYFMKFISTVLAMKANDD